MRWRNEAFRRHSAIPGVLAVLGSLAACSGDGGLSVAPPVVSIEPAPGPIDFGEFVLGRSEVGDPREIVIRNVGPVNVSIEASLPEGAPFSLSYVPERLEPGEKVRLFVRFVPTEVGDYDVPLVIRTPDPERAVNEFRLRGQARETCSLKVGPDSQRFLLGEIREVEIGAMSSQACEIVTLAVDESVFALVDPPALPLVVPPGESVRIQVQHVATPPQAGPPARSMLIREGEGSQREVTFVGEPPVYGCFSVSPLQLSFPRSDPQQVVRRRIRVKNDCGRAASISSAVIGRGSRTYSIEEASFPVEVGPKQTHELVVAYRARNPVADIGLVVVNTNDAANPRFSVDVVGSAQEPRFIGFPSAINFGDVAYRPGADPDLSECRSAPRTLQIHNAGDGTMQVEPLRPDGDAGFYVASATADGAPIDVSVPFLVAPSSRVLVELRFSPTMDGAHAGRLEVRHSAAQPPLVVALRGVGRPQGPVTDRFTQLEGPKVDILWVIDASCSMFDEQQRLVDNLSQFVGYADSQSADYRMAVTVADSRSSEAGKFRRCWPHPSTISSDYEDTATREEAFDCMFRVGTNGVFIEAGLGGAMRALERAQSEDQDLNSNPNAGFLRPDAKLAIVTMSDEEDQSVEQDILMRDYFFSVKGSHRPDRVSVHAIAGPTGADGFDTSCTAINRGGAEPGFRYRWMAQETGGVFQSICESNWRPVLRELGLNVFTPLDEWDLSQPADEGTLEVLVNGVPVASSEAEGYVYRAASNSVRFAPAATPPPGADVSIHYEARCEP